MPALGAEPKPPVPEATEAPLILVVDDDPTVRELVVRHLRGRISAVVRSGGREGLRLARELRPAAIILDVMMPDLDGWTVLAAIRATLHWQAFPWF